MSAIDEAIVNAERLIREAAEAVKAIGAHPEAEAIRSGSIPALIENLARDSRLFDNVRIALAEYRRPKGPTVTLTHSASHWSSRLELVVAEFVKATPTQIVVRVRDQEMRFKRATGYEVAKRTMFGGAFYRITEVELARLTAEGIVK